MKILYMSILFVKANILSCQKKALTKKRKAVRRHSRFSIVSLIDSVDLRDEVFCLVIQIMRIGSVIHGNTERGIFGKALDVDVNASARAFRRSSGKC